jgi:hypothetical protein
VSQPTSSSKGTIASSAKVVTRHAVASSLGVLAWALVAGLAVLGFSQQVTWHDSDVVSNEVVCFAYAFSVAGTITGLATSVAAGQRRRAAGFIVISIAVVAASVPAIRWLILRATAPNIQWAEAVWRSAVRGIRFGSVLGALCGLGASGLVIPAVILERRVARWQFGLIVAGAVALLGSWALPVAISLTSDLVVPLVGVNYRYLYDEGLRGAGIGAGTGSLAGAVVVGLTARWSGRG